MASVSRSREERRGTQALAWEQDAEVPIAVVEAADYSHLGHAEQVWLDEH